MRPSLTGRRVAASLVITVAIQLAALGDAMVTPEWDNLSDT